MSLPSFFPSVSSVVKTDSSPVDYLEFLCNSRQPLFLVSAYDVAHCSLEDQQLVGKILKNSKERGTAILMDSGNYESYWKKDESWTVDEFRKVAKNYEHSLCFCFDNQEPPNSAEAIADDVIKKVICDQEHAIGIVCPIIHGASEFLPQAAKVVGEQISPELLAIPERELGQGIVERIRTIRKVRQALDQLDAYCPLHLLGTGDPLSIIAYSMAGADSFDGLEWCEIVVDGETGHQCDFQHWDFFRHQTRWGRNRKIHDGYKQYVLMHNLNFYLQFMADLHDAVNSKHAEEFLSRYATENQVSVLIKAIGESD